MGSAVVKPVECAVCLDMVSAGRVTTNCGHTFHRTCIEECLRYNTACPICRCEIVTLDKKMTPEAAAKAAAERRACKRQRRLRRRLERRLFQHRAHLAMLVEIQRMREVGFLHHVGEAQARANYFRRLQARRH